MKTPWLALFALSSVSVFACAAGSANRSSAATPTSDANPVVSASGAPSGSPSAMSLQEQGYWAKLNEHMTGYMASLNEACGTKIQGAYDTKSYQGRFSESEGSDGITGYVESSCGSLAAAVQDLCINNPAAKKAISSKIQKVECRLGRDGMTDVKLNGGTLTGSIDPQAGGAVMQSAANQYLMKSL